VSEKHAARTGDPNLHVRVRIFIIKGNKLSKYVVYWQHICFTMKKQSKKSTESSDDPFQPSLAAEPVATYLVGPVIPWAVQARATRGGADGRSGIAGIRRGRDYSAIEELSARMGMPVKDLLPLFELAQTTYNKKKREQARMGRRDTELLIYLNALMDFGFDVFNREGAKFQRWLRKPNISLGGATPFSLLDTITGIQEVQGCLERIEYGNFA